MGSKTGVRKMGRGTSQSKVSESKMLSLYFLCFLVRLLLHKGLILMDEMEAQMDGDRK